jgi:Cu(I)/Ag(I) efflux system membrane fusion protein
MNKPAAVGSLVVIALGAFIAGHISGRSSQETHSSAKKILYYVDPMHPAYKSDKPGIAPDCGMALEPVYEGDALATKLPLPAGAVSISSEKQQLIGVRTETVEKNSGSRLLRTTGRVAPDDNRVYRLMAGTDGWIQALQDNPIGTVVKKDQVLATFYSREFRNAEQAYLGSLASQDRLRGVREPEEQNQNPNQNPLQNRVGDSSIRINEEQLKTLGMGEPQIRELAKTRQVTGDITLVAPVDGVVLSRSVSPLQRFDKGTEFYRVADLSKVWIIADVFGDEASALRPGAKATVLVRELSKTVTATVSDSPPLFDPASRTLKLRLDADNPGMLLRPDMYVDVEFRAPAPSGISVPAEAVLDSGMQKIVYLETADGVFEPRAVELGTSYGGRVTVKRGLAEGDRVVTAGNFLIDSESRMRPAALRTINEKRDSVEKSPAPAQATASTLDPVCGMSIDRAKSVASGLTETYRGETFVFCSDKCHKQFLDDPAKYADDRLRSAADSGTGRRND